MPLPRRALAASALTFAMLLVAFPATVAAKDPGYPLPGHTPAFVTERDAGTWDDCLWASAAMMFDKWTAGEVKVSANRLRGLSGDRTGGSNFVDLRKAAKQLGFNLKTSPDGGARITWGQLLKRLREGGGAVLLGDYHDLPRFYGRWDPAFWKKTGAKDNHALYLDHANRRGTRVWVMDPLAPAGWKGEWIPTSALRSFAWQTADGGLWAVMTPKAKPAPFAGVKLGDPSATGVGSSLRVIWPIAKVPPRWRLPATRIESTFTAIDAPAAPPAGSVMVAASTDRLDQEGIDVHGKRLIVTTDVPTTPGVYEVSVGVRERRFDRVVATVPLTVYVAGERRASVTVSLDTDVIRPRQQVRARVVVINSGTTAWADAPAPAAELVSRRTRLELRWVDAANPTHVIPVGRSLPLDLASRTSSVLKLELTAPGPGDWLLVAGATDAIDGSFNDSGGRVPRLGVTAEGPRTETATASSSRRWSWNRRHGGTPRWPRTGWPCSRRCARRSPRVTATSCAKGFECSPRR